MGLFTSFQLKSRDPETRRRAARSLGAPGKTSAVPQLEPLLADPEWTVREAAIAALGVIAVPEAAPLLVGALGATEAVQDKEGAPALRAAAVEALSQVGQPAVAGLLDMLRGRSPRLREAAIEALGRIGGPEAVSALTPSLNDDRSNVRQAAALAIARSGGEAGVPPLAGQLGHKDPATRKCIVEALGSVGSPAAADAIRTALADRDRAVRDAAIGALAQLPHSHATSALVDAFLSGDRDLRVATATVLKAKDWVPTDSRGRILHAVLHGEFDKAASEGDEALEPLLLTLSDRTAASRAGAARALGRLADPRAAGPLANLLSDSDATVREAAASAIAGIGPSAAIPLSRHVDDRSAATKNAVNQVIGAIGPSALVDHLVARLSAGEAATHAGTPLRVVRERQALDDAREAADALGALVPRLIDRLEPGPLQALASLGDVMLVEEGQRPTSSDTIDCRAIRAAAAGRLPG